MSGILLKGRSVKYIVVFSFILRTSLCISWFFLLVFVEPSTHGRDSRWVSSFIKDPIEHFDTASYFCRHSILE